MNFSLSFIIKKCWLDLSLKKYEIYFPSKKREEEYNNLQENTTDPNHLKEILHLNFLPIDDSKLILYGLTTNDLDDAIKNIEGVPEKFSSKVIIKKISQIYQVDCNEFAPPLYKRKNKRISKKIEKLEDLIDFSMEGEDGVKKTRQPIPKVLSIAFLPFYFHEVSTKIYGKNNNIIDLFYELYFSYLNKYLPDMDQNLLNNINKQFKIMRHNIRFFSNIYKELAFKYMKSEKRKNNKKRQIEENDEKNCKKVVKSENRKNNKKRQIEENDHKVLKKRKIK
jgi:hypothetical protein